MNIKLDSHSISSRSSIVRFVGTVLISIFCLGASAANASEETVKTRFGTLRLQQTTKDYHCKANLLFNGKSIWKNECSSFGVSMYNQVYSLPNHDIVIVSHYNKGSAAGASYSAIVIDQKKSPKILEHKDFQTLGDSGFETPKIVGNHLEIDLGYQNKLRTVIKIEGEMLTVSYEKPTSIPPLTKDQCFWLYSQALDECSTKDAGGQCKNLNNNFNFTGATERGIKDIENFPAFDPAKFNMMCETACKQHKLPDEKTFRHQICPNTKFN